MKPSDLLQNGLFYHKTQNPELVNLNLHTTHFKAPLARAYTENLLAVDYKARAYVQQERGITRLWQAKRVITCCHNALL